MKTLWRSKSEGHLLPLLSHLHSHLFLVQSHLQGHLLLLRFYLHHLVLLWRLPSWLTSPAQLDHHLQGLREGSQTSLTLTVPSRSADIYNRNIKELGVELRKLHFSQGHPTSTGQLVMAVRLVMVAAAWSGSIAAVLLVGLAQFLVAPYSFWISFTQGLNFLQFVHIPHYLAFYGLLHLCSYLLPYIPVFLIECGQLPVNTTTITIFFLADLCFSLYQEGWRHPPLQMLQNMLHGSLNNKTMPLVVLLICCHHYPSLSLWLWLVEGYLLQLTPRISTLINSASIHYNALFYHHHRIAHAPHVYEQAHKMHHGTHHGTNAFEASFYACGIAEEYFLLVAELLLLQFCGLPPASLNWFVLIVFGNRNKYGHTETANKAYSYHTDHHKLHLKNFGSFNCLMDCYFSTVASGYKSYNILPGGLTENDYNTEGLVDEIEIRVSFSTRDGVTSFTFTDSETEVQEPPAVITTVSEPIMDYDSDPLDTFDLSEGLKVPSGGPRMRKISDQLLSQFVPHRESCKR